jgi:VWFA-related protein
MIRTIAVAVALAAAIHGQTPEAPQFRGGVVNVQVPVTVMAKGGRPINTLAANDFQLFDNGVAQTFALDVVTHPVSLVVAVQANSTTKEVLPQVRAASALLAPLVAGDTGEVALLAFDHRVQQLMPFTNRPEEINAGFQKLEAGSGPHHLDDAAMEAIRLLNTRAKDRKKILLLISQDRDEGSAVSTRQVFEQAELDGILVYAVSMKTALAPPSMKRKNPVPPEGRAPLPMGNIQTQTTDVQNGGYAPTVAEMYEIVRGMKAHNTLEAYTEITGGSQQKFTNQKTLDSAIQQIGLEVHSQYVLTFAPLTPTTGFHNITVQVRSRGLTVRTRRAYRLAGEVR